MAATAPGGEEDFSDASEIPISCRLAGLGHGAASACFRPVYTVPERAGPVDRVLEFDLEVPPYLETRHVDFAATEYATDADSRYSGAAGGRGFLKVYAVDLSTGESVLLIYEDIARRKEPVQVIRFRKASPGFR